MSKMNEAGKRDFVSQMITLTEEEAATMVEKGFDPATKIASLKEMQKDSDTAEVNQQKVLATAKEATILSNEKLEIVYKEASDLADLISGLYGKNSELVKRIRKFRN